MKAESHILFTIINNYISNKKLILLCQDFMIHMLIFLTNLHNTTFLYLTGNPCFFYPLLPQYFIIMFDFRLLQCLFIFKKVILTQKLMEWKYYFYIYLQRWVKKDDSQKYNQRLC